MDTVPQTKVCRKCGAIKPLDAFRRHASSSLGRQRLCAECCRAEHRAWRAKKKAAASCDRCGGPTGAPGVTCESCKAIVRAQRRARIDAGACIACGAARGSDGSSIHCRSCRDTANERSKKRQRQLLASGLCAWCGKAASVAGSACRRCWFRTAACRNLGSSRLGPLLEQIWAEQQGRCALTGVPLRWDARPSLDHIVPRSRGGTNERANLRWVTFEANRAKNDLTDAELVAMCRKIIATLDPGELPAAVIP